MTQLTQHPPKQARINTTSSADGWISERALALLYGIPQKKLKMLLRHTGLPYRETRNKTEHGTVFLRTYWPAHLHPSSKSTSKQQ